MALLDLLASTSPADLWMMSGEAQKWANREGCRAELFKGQLRR